MSGISELIILIPILLLSLSFHEFSHGYASFLLGDPTPKQQGRLTMNPLAHLDVFGTLVLIMTRRFGWAKPVPINPNYYKSPRKGLMVVGFAGPGSNFFLAIIFSLLVRGIITISNINMTAIGQLKLSGLVSTSLRFFVLAVIINLSLGIFNLLPVPPLDGSKILRGMLPRSFDHYFDILEGPAGMVVLLILAYTGLLWKIIGPVVNFFFGLLL